MDEKDIDKKTVTEEDYDLFYGFVDSVFEEKNQLDDTSDSTSSKNSDSDALDLTDSEWTPEPFEEYLVGLPQQEAGKYYSLNIIEPSRANQIPGDVNPNHYGTISGIILSITISAAFIFAVYHISKEPTARVTLATTNTEQIEQITQSISSVESSVEKNLNTVEISMAKNLNAVEQKMNQSLNSVEKKIALSLNAVESKITQSVQAVETKIQSIQAVEQQMKTIAMQLNTLNSIVASQRSDKVAALGQAAWVINLASFRSKDNAIKLKAKIQDLGIPLELFTITIKSLDWTRIRAIGFRSKAEASQALHDINNTIRFDSAWVGRRQ